MLTIIVNIGGTSGACFAALYPLLILVPATSRVPVVLIPWDQAWLWSG